MKLAKLKKQLARDVKKSPKKAALLATLALVALYFWAPLVVGWCTGKSEDDKKTTVFLTPQAPTAVAQGSAPAPQSWTFDWQRAADSIAHDELMQTAGIDVTVKAPFRDPSQPDNHNDEDTPEETVRPKVVTADSLGLSLSGTLVGGRRRVAVINGRAYTEGDILETTAGDVLSVMRVQARHVIVLHEGRPLELELTRPGNGSATSDNVVLRRTE